MAHRIIAADIAHTLRICKKKGNRKNGCSETFKRDVVTFSENQNPNSRQRFKLVGKKRNEAHIRPPFIIR
eukprot:5957575-Amphidinium_carterae.1